MTTHEVLVAARNLIDREGWIQRKYHREGEGYCMLGATGTAYSGHPAVGYLPADVVLQEVLGNNHSLSLFNDAEGRTKEEVLAVFDKAIAATAPEPAVPNLDVPELVA